MGLCAVCKKRDVTVKYRVTCSKECADIYFKKTWNKLLDTKDILDSEDGTYQSDTELQEVRT